MEFELRKESPTESDKEENKPDSPTSSGDEEATRECRLFNQVTPPGSALAKPQFPSKESKHEFSSPWQNSDLVLIIEDQKIHVHRVILQMMSPVLCHILKETDSNEVPLLRTKVGDFVDLLRVIYPQFKNNITLDNVEYIYRLAEEYQIESVAELCREYLVHVKKTTFNAMKILVTAQICHANEARKQCYKILKDLTVAKLKNDRYVENLDEDSLRNVLLPKAERLEKCLREIQPQLVGLLDCVLYWCLSNVDKKQASLCGSEPNSANCPVHHSSAMAYSLMQTRIKCSACKAMILKMVRNSLHVSRFGRTTCTEHYYSRSGTYFDERIVDVLQEMFSLLKM